MAAWHTNHPAHRAEDHESDDVAASAHQATCLTCYRFYRRGLEAEGWHLSGAGSIRQPAHVPPCRHCAGVAFLWVRMWRGDPVSGERQRLTVCHDCGHVELLA